MQHDTWTGRTLGEPTIEQWDALKAFALANGRTWKSKLNALWLNGAYNYAVLGEADPALLQQIRNTFGPRWLTLIDITRPR